MNKKKQKKPQPPGQAQVQTTAWQRSDKISLVALVVSLIALLTSIVLNFVNLSFQYREEIAIDTIPLDRNYVHVYSALRIDTASVYVDRVATWYRFRITNKSNKPVSLTAAFFREDEKLRTDLQSPFYMGLEYEDRVAVHLRRPFELPVRLEIGETIEFYALLPTSVTRALGGLLIAFLRSNDHIIDTEAETILFDKSYFKRLQNNMLDSYNASKLSDFIKVTDINVRHINVERGILWTKNGQAFFRDSTNSAQDGFIYEDGLILHNLVSDAVLKSERLTFPMMEVPFKKYYVIFQTGNGKFFEREFSAASTLFERMK